MLKSNSWVPLWDANSWANRGNNATASKMYSVEDQRMRPGVLFATKISQSWEKWLCAEHIQHQGFDPKTPLQGVCQKWRAGCQLLSKGIKLRTPEWSYCPANSHPYLLPSSCPHSIPEPASFLDTEDTAKKYGRRVTSPAQHPKSNSTVLTRWDNRSIIQIGSSRGFYGFRGKNLSSIQGEVEKKKGTWRDKKIFTGIHQEEILNITGLAYL